MPLNNQLNYYLSMKKITILLILAVNFCLAQTTKEDYDYLQNTYPILLESNRQIDKKYNLNEIEPYVNDNYSIIVNEVYKGIEFIGLFSTLTKVKKKKHNKVDYIFYPLANIELSNYHRVLSSKLGISIKTNYDYVKRLYFMKKNSKT